MLRKKRIKSLSLIWADGAYRRAFLKEGLEDLGIILTVVGETKSGYWIQKDKIQELKPAGKGFQVQPRRWVVERTFAWLNRNRRLSKDYEYLTEISESYLYIGMIRISLRRLIKKQTVKHPLMQDVYRLCVVGDPILSPAESWKNKDNS
jgi:transposase